MRVVERWMIAGSLWLSLAGCSDPGDDDASSPTPEQSPSPADTGTPASSSPTPEPTAPATSPSPATSPTVAPSPTPVETSTPTAPTPTPGATATPTAPPDVTATPVVSPTPSVSPTPEPTPTATPAPTPTPSPTPAPDGDGDGYTGLEGDCRDDNAGVYPGAPELCDGIDNDCDDQVDEALDVTVYQDQDGDGHGDPSTAEQRCDDPAGYVSDGDDCDDTDPDAYPGNLEAPTECGDGIDQDCSGADLSCQVVDLDGDGYTPLEGDCNDASAQVNPGQSERCNGIDDDCNGAIDEGVTTAYYPDVDQDGYGAADPTRVIDACAPPTGYTDQDGDCDDTDPDISPDSAEVCNGLDDDCDGLEDNDAPDGTAPEGATTWYADQDKDGYGDPGNTIEACDQPPGYLSTAGDCNDAKASIHPGAADVCDGIDTDCDGDVDPDATCVSEAWRYRRPIDVTNSTGATLSDFQVGFTLDTYSLISYGKLQGACQDLRVTDETGTLLPFWIETQPATFACGGTGTRVWTRTSIPSAGRRLYVYYGNPSAAAAQSGSSTFLFFEDFSSQQAFDTRWTKVANGTAGSFVVSGGYLEIQGGATPTIGLTPSVGTNDYTVETDMYYPGSSTVKFTGNAGGVLARYNGTGNYYHHELDQNNLNQYLFTNYSYVLMAGVASTNSFNTWYRGGIKVAGTSVSSTTQPQNLSVSATSSAWSAGLPGLYRWDANIRFDNFRVRRAVVSEPTSTVGAEQAVP